MGLISKGKFVICFFLANPLHMINLPTVHTPPRDCMCGPWDPRLFTVVSVRFCSPPGRFRVVSHSDFCWPWFLQVWWPRNDSISVFVWFPETSICQASLLSCLGPALFMSIREEAEVTDLRYVKGVSGCLHNNQNGGGQKPGESETLQ